MWRQAQVSVAAFLISNPASPILPTSEQPSACMLQKKGTVVQVGTGAPLIPATQLLLSDHSSSAARAWLACLSVAAGLSLLGSCRHTSTAWHPAQQHAAAALPWPAAAAATAGAAHTSTTAAAQAAAATSAACSGSGPVSAQQEACAGRAAGHRRAQQSSPW